MAALQSIMNRNQNDTTGRYRFLHVVYVVLDVFIVLLVVRAMFVFVPAWSHPIGDMIIAATDIFVHPFEGLLPTIVADPVVIVWDVLFAIVVYDIAITVFVWLLKRVLKIE